MTIADDAQRIMVTVHTPKQRIRTFLFDGTGRHIGIDPDYFVERPLRRLLNSRTTPYRSSRLATLAMSVLLVIAALFGFAGTTHAVSVRVVLTGSMVPAINPGDAIVAIDDRFRAPRIGDVIVYTGKRFDGTTVAPFAHRIIGKAPDGGWIVKGDANPAADVQHPTAADISSVVVATIPHVGQFLSPQLLMALLVAGLALWLIVDGLGSTW